MSTPCNPTHSSSLSDASGKVSGPVFLLLILPLNFRRIYFPYHPPGKSECNSYLWCCTSAYLMNTTMTMKMMKNDWYSTYLKSVIPHFLVLLPLLKAFLTSIFFPPSWRACLGHWFLSWQSAKRNITLMIMNQKNNETLKICL